MSKTALDLEVVEFAESPAAPSAARPINIARSLFHVMSGAVSLTLIRVLPGRAPLVAASAAFALFAWTCETARRRSPEVNEKLMRFFGPVAHPQERHRVNSSTWYVSALFLLALLAPPDAAELGVVVLAIADPVAGLIGRRFGRTRLRAGRSLEGTLAFFTAGTLAALAVLGAFHALPAPTMMLLALTSAAAGALAELASTRLDDNFTIPIAAAAAASAAIAFV